MQSRDAFSACHPLVNLAYFALVLLFSMCFLDPACLGVSLLCAVAYSGYLNGPEALGRQVRRLLPLALTAAVFNGLFNHEGATILAYFPSGNPLTLESVLYGLAAAGMLWAVMTWFGCCGAVFTSDKFLYLFGRVIPALSLVLSMALRFVPRFKRQAREVAEARRCVGRDVSHGPLLRRLADAAALLSILVTWSLENAIETADSMKSRGYGLPGRTAFSIYRLDSQDKLCLLWLAALGGFILWGWASGGFAWRYYPTVKAPSPTLLSLALRGAYLALCLTPLILDRKEDARWRRLRSAI